MEAEAGRVLLIDEIGKMETILVARENREALPEQLAAKLSPPLPD